MAMKRGMGHFSDSLHMETCRGRNCRFVGTRAEMVKASEAHKQPNRRGWYCDSCAAMIMDPIAEIKRRRGQGRVITPKDMP